MSDHLVPGDERFHDDKQLIADLVGLNERLSRYILRQLDADAGRIRSTSPDDERALAETMATLAAKVQERANRRAGPDAPPVLEGDAVLRRQIASRPTERC